MFSGLGDAGFPALAQLMNLYGKKVSHTGLSMTLRPLVPAGQAHGSQTNRLSHRSTPPRDKQVAAYQTGPRE